MKSRVGLNVSGLLVLLSALVMGCGEMEEPPGNRVPGSNFEAPLQPTEVEVSPGDGQVSVSWTAPTFDGGKVISLYIVRALEAQTVRAEVKVPGNVTSATLTGLTNGVAYSVTVSAENVVGATASAPVESVIPRRVLGAPRDVQATPGDRQVTLSWTPPEATGLPVTGYTVTVHSGETSLPAQPSTESAVTVTGLENGKAYTFTVTATNADGTGPGAAPVTSTPRTVPSALEGVYTTGKPGAVWVYLLEAPKNDGGSPIQGYRIFYVDEETGQESSVDVASPGQYLIRELPNGRNYLFSVVSINAAGLSPRSNVVRAKAVGFPSAPRNFTGHTDPGQLRFTWDMPEDDGGDPIQYCEIAFSFDLSTLYRIEAPATEYIVKVPAGISYTGTLTCSNLEYTSAGATATSTAQ